TYIIEADAMAHQLAVSWQREQAGQTGAWNPERYGEGSAYQKMAQAFEAVMDNAATQEPGAVDRPETLRTAMAASFREWLDHDLMRETYAANTKQAYQTTQKIFKDFGGREKSWQRDLPRPEQLVALTGHVAGDTSGVPYLSAADMRAALDRVAVDYQAYGWADTFDQRPNTDVPVSQRPADRAWPQVGPRRLPPNHGGADQDVAAARPAQKPG
ncbi:MAG: DUF6782 family putative metallopeptidase, partial [Pseudomonadota bacterium]